MSSITAAKRAPIRAACFRTERAIETLSARLPDQPTSEWAGRNIPVTWDLNRKKWGIPATVQIDDGLVHLRHGGWNTFRIDVPATWVFMAKVATRNDAVGYLHDIAQIAVHSQLTLSEAAGIVVETMRCDPRRGVANETGLRRFGNDCAHRAISLVNAWQARETDQRQIGDTSQLVERIDELRELAIRAHIRRGEIDLDRQRQSLRRPA